MKRVVIFLILLSSIGVFAQNKVHFEKRDIAGGYKNSFTIKIPYFEKSEIEKMWKEKMKNFGGKTSFSNIIKNTYTISEISNANITDLPYSTHSKIVDKVSDSLTILTAIEFADNTFLIDSTDKGYPIIENQLLDFAFNITKVLYNENLSDAQKQYDRANSKLNSLEKENLSLNSKNAKLEGKISKTNLNISKYNSKKEQINLDLEKGNLSLNKKIKLKGKLISYEKKFQKEDYNKLKYQEKIHSNDSKISGNKDAVEKLNQDVIKYKKLIENYKERLLNLKR